MRSPRSPGWVAAMVGDRVGAARGFCVRLGGRGLMRFLVGPVAVPPCQNVSWVRIPLAGAGVIPVEIRSRLQTAGRSRPLLVGPSQDSQTRLVSSLRDRARTEMRVVSPRLFFLKKKVALLLLLLLPAPCRPARMGMEASRSDEGPRVGPSPPGWGDRVPSTKHGTARSPLRIRCWWSRCSKAGMPSRNVSLC